MTWDDWNVDSIFLIAMVHSRIFVLSRGVVLLVRWGRWGEVEVRLECVARLVDVIKVSSRVYCTDVLLRCVNRVQWCIVRVCCHDVPVECRGSKCTHF